jgi:hypothetical protein
MCKADIKEALLSESNKLQINNILLSPPLSLSPSSRVLGWEEHDYIRGI